MNIRAENWGAIQYDDESDEFSALVNGDGIAHQILRPLSAGCLVTGKCNLRCRFCYGNLEALPKTEMTSSQWHTAFGRLKNVGLMRVDLSGGEPTLRRDLPEIAASALNRGMAVIVSTNGLVLHKKGPADFPTDVRFHVSIDSGLADVHARSRRLPTLGPSYESLQKSCDFIRASLEHGHRVRVLTCIGPHNEDLLFELGERIVALGVVEWNISRILRAGRAETDYEERWTPRSSEHIQNQISEMRDAYPWLRIRYSDRTRQNGYFLLVLPDGTVATQFTDGRDKVTIDDINTLSYERLLLSRVFNLQQHVSKWVSETYRFQEASLEVGNN